jgi:hypothetical protein
LESPRYEALTEAMPAGGSVLEVQLASPDPSRVPIHIPVVIPRTVSENNALPVGIPAPGAFEETAVE